MFSFHREHFPTGGVGYRQDTANPTRGRGIDRVVTADGEIRVWRRHACGAVLPLVSVCCRGVAGVRGM